MLNYFLKHTIGRKILMALSGFFLMFFLIQHLAINLLSVFSEDLFNSASHFMGTNFFVQFILQPVLIFGVVFHLAMGVVLEIQNRRATAQRYAYNAHNNSSWMSRNMIITGIMIFLFLCLHFVDFWIPEIEYKYIDVKQEVNDRYFHELEEKFHDLWRVVLYVLSFCFLSLHLLHGFQSSFQSVGFTKRKYASFIKKASVFYAIVVPFGFIFIAIYHYLIHIL